MCKYNYDVVIIFIIYILRSHGLFPLKLRIKNLINYKKLKLRHNFIYISDIIYFTYYTATKNEIFLINQQGYS